MTIPDAAIEAAAEAFANRCGCGEPAFHRGYATTAIEAAMPAIREAIAQEIEADLYSTNGYGLPYIDGRKDAARIVRGGAA